MNIRKYVRGLIAAVLFAGMVPAAQAATSGPHNFNVTVTLTSACTLPVAITPLAFGTYTAFQGGVLNATPTAATFSCTRGLTGITANFDTAAPDSTAAARCRDGRRCGRDSRAAIRHYCYARNGHGGNCRYSVLDRYR